MKLPIPGSRGRVIIDFLATKPPMTIADVRTALVTELTRKVTGHVLTDLNERGFIHNMYGSGHAKQDDQITLSRLCRELLEDEEDDESEKKQARGQITPPRQVNVLTSPPLSKSLYINTKGTRPDSDWSQFKSRQI